jgi:hypothetical protein
MSFEDCTDLEKVKIRDFGLRLRLEEHKIKK